MAKRSTRQLQCQDYTLDRLRESFVFEELEFELEKVEEFENCDAALEEVKELVLQGLEDAESHREFHRLMTKVQQLKHLGWIWTLNYRSSRPSVGLNLEKQG